MLTSYPARPSIAIADKIAYDTSLPRPDILVLKVEQWDGEGWTVRQKKKRGEHLELWQPMSPEGVQMVNGYLKGREIVSMSGHVLTNEQTGKPWNEEFFTRNFAQARKRVGIKGRTFHDLRRTAPTEIGNRGATNAEIVKFSGHNINSPVLKTYVQPDREAAKRGAEKRSNKGKTSDD